MVEESVLSASPGNLLETQIPGPHSRPTEARREGEGGQVTVSGRLLRTLRFAIQWLNSLVLTYRLDLKGHTCTDKSASRWKQN